MTALVFFVGFPASGKTTIRRSLLEKKEVDEVISPDEIRFYEFKTQFDPTIEPNIWAIAKDRVRTCLSKGKRCLLDCTNIDPDKRKDFIAIANDLKSRKKAIVLNIDFDVAMARNAQRNPIFVEGTKIGQVVPDLAMFRMKQQWDSNGLGNTKKSITTALKKDGFDEVEVINRYADERDCGAMGGEVITLKSTGKKMCRVHKRDDLSLTTKYYFME